MNKKIIPTILLCLISNLAIGMDKTPSQEKLSIVKLRNFENKTLFTPLVGSIPSTIYVSSCPSTLANCKLYLRNDTAWVTDQNHNTISLPQLETRAVHSLHRVGQLARAMDPKKRISWLSEKIIVTGSSGIRYLITEIIETTLVIPKQAIITTDIHTSFPAGIVVHKDAQLSWSGEITQAYKSGNNLSISYLKEGLPAIKLMNNRTITIREDDVKTLQQAQENNTPFYMRIFGSDEMVVYQITKFEKEKSEKLEPNRADDKSQTPADHPKLSESTSRRKTIMAFVLGMGVGISGFLAVKYSDRIFDTTWLNAFLNKMFNMNLKTAI